MLLEQIREEIDQVDKELVKLFVRRMELSGQIAGEKKKSGTAILNSAREASVLEKVAEEAGENMSRQVRALYLTIFEISRDYQKNLIEEETGKKEVGDSCNMD